MDEHKFNFSEAEKEAEKEAKKEQTVNESKKAVQEDVHGLFISIKQFLGELLDFREDTDRDATIAAIKADIPFKGATAWILICSIFVASIGLNASSTAVVIGAMLISPLMGPILGIGLSVAINDIDTLKKALINLATMIVLSLLTAFLFFKFFPLSKDTSELLGRVQPDIRDVLIAFFGGLALIIARTKKGTIASVIFGVAIATALMPPLCTAGYGLAIGNWDYFTGAMYLFTINTIFIAMATFLVLKILKFPMLKYANSAKRKRTARIASVLAVLVMIPAILTFLSVLKKSNFETDAAAFIKNETKTLPNASYIEKYATATYNDEGESIIELVPFGAEEIPQTTIDLLESRFANYKSLKNTKLYVNQVENRSINNLEYMEELRSRDSVDLLSQSQKIVYLEDKVRALSRLERDQIPFKEVVDEAQINYSNLESIAYAKQITSDFTTIDTLAVFTVKWKDDTSDPENVAKEVNKLERWLKLKLKLDTLQVKTIK